MRSNWGDPSESLGSNRWVSRNAAFRHTGWSKHGQHGADYSNRVMRVMFSRYWRPSLRAGSFWVIAKGRLMREARIRDMAPPAIASAREEWTSALQFALPPGRGIFASTLETGLLT